MKEISSCDTTRRPHDENAALLFQAGNISWACAFQTRYINMKICSHTNGYSSSNLNYRPRIILRKSFDLFCFGENTEIEIYYSTRQSSNASTFETKKIFKFSSLIIRFPNCFANCPTLHSLIFNCDALEARSEMCANSARIFALHILEGWN